MTPRERLRAARTKELGALGAAIDSTTLGGGTATIPKVLAAGKALDAARRAADLALIEATTAFLADQADAMWRDMVTVELLREITPEAILADLERDP